jgi:hypothetical protein
MCPGNGRRYYRGRGPTPGVPDLFSLFKYLLTSALRLLNLSWASLRIVSQAMVMFMWLVGTGFGALWTSSLERGRGKSARLYGSCMAYSYFGAFVLTALDTPGVRLRWLALAFFLFVAFLAAMVVIGRRRLRRQGTRQNATTR